LVIPQKNTKRHLLSSARYTTDHHLTRKADLIERHIPDDAFSQYFHPPRGIDVVIHAQFDLPTTKAAMASLPPCLHLARVRHEYNWRIFVERFVLPAPFAVAPRDQAQRASRLVGAGHASLDRDAAPPSAGIEERATAAVFARQEGDVTTFVREGSLPRRPPPHHPGGGTNRHRRLRIHRPGSTRRYCARRGRLYVWDGNCDFGCERTPHPPLLDHHPRHHHRHRHRHHGRPSSTRRTGP